MKAVKKLARKAASPGTARNARAAGARPEGGGASPVRRVEIDADHAGQRLDNYLLNALKGVPKSHVYRIVRKGEVRINKGRAKPDYRLQDGDVLRLPPLRTARNTLKSRLQDSGGARGFDWLLDRIVYEDEAFMVVDKPGGLAVHGGSGVSLGLIEMLRELRPQTRYLELAHRLDRDTSGCLLIAKKRATLVDLHAQLRAGKIDKRYQALVKGKWNGPARRVTASLIKTQSPTGTRQVRVVDDGLSNAPEGKLSHSRFSPRRVYAQASLMEIRLLTGRTHQARVHAGHIGHPIAGDEKYGDSDFNRQMGAIGLKRLFLHAASLGFAHPLTRAKLWIEAPLPADLTDVLERLA